VVAQFFIMMARAIVWDQIPRALIQALLVIAVADPSL